MSGKADESQVSAAPMMTRREMEHQRKQAVENLAAQERRRSRAWLDLTDAQLEYEKAKQAVADAKGTIEIWDQRLAVNHD